MPASSVGTYTQIPDFITDSDEYKGLEYAEMVTLIYLLKSMKRDSNGMLSFPVSIAESIGMDNTTRRRCLRKLERAGIILKTAKHNGKNPDMYAVFWRPFKPNNDAVSEKIGVFREWANRQRLHFKRYFLGEKIPDGLKVLTVNHPQYESSTL